MIKRQAKELQQFFYTQAFADGFRITLAILLPALILSYFDLFDLGLNISLGAACVSMVDAPGPLIHKRNGMMYCALLIFITAIVTMLVQHNIYLLGTEILVFSFLFSMFNIYGIRAASVGSACMLLLILTMDKPIYGTEIFEQAGAFLGGGIWYLSVSLLFYSIRPFRPAQRALGECLREVAKYLSIKSDFYNSSTDLEEDYRRLLAQQAVVSEKQDAVREILFKTRQFVKETSATGRKMVLLFVDTVDMFEDITASYYDYELVRKRFGETGILDKIASYGHRVANELDVIGLALQSGTDYALPADIEDELRHIKTAIDNVANTEGSSNLILKKLLVNLRNLLQHLKNITPYFTGEEPRKTKTRTEEYNRFVGHQSFDPKIFWSNLSLKSATFRHALRVCIACVVGFTVAKLIAYGHHSYWILMTTAFILKPAFGLTNQRNYQRILGTIAGGTVGVIILYFIPNKHVLFAFFVLFMLGNYSFQRVNYLITVFCTTPFVLILFRFLGLGVLTVAKERVLDTAIGCVLALAASYFLFPSWESNQLKIYLQQMLKANAAYFSKLAEGLAGAPINLLEYKLARKEVYVSSGNLSAAFQRMLSEPKSKQHLNKEIHQFVVLNNIFFFNLATIASVVMKNPPKPYPAPILTTVKKTISLLQESLNRFEHTEPVTLTLPTTPAIESETSADYSLLKEQIDFLYKLSYDIDKTAKSIITA